MQDQFYILATSPQAAEQTRVLKHGESFAVFDRTGFIRPHGLGELGLYHEGTRFLSHFELLLGGGRPLLLSSTIGRDGQLTVDLTNPDITFQGEVVLRRDTIHLGSTSFLWDAVWYTRFRIRNFDLGSVDLRFELRFAVDYADIFEVRGRTRARRGRLLSPLVGHDAVELAYEGLDGRMRGTLLRFSPAPAELSASCASFRARLPPRDELICYITVACESEPERSPRILTHDEALARSVVELRNRQSACVHLHALNERFNDWVERAAADLSMMTTETAQGPYPYAGIPWFSAVFGRDGIITALEVLSVDPGLARGVLSFLASTQASEMVQERDAEPGKIVHEIRRGEMAALGEIPLSRYYGTADATPLFVMLAGAYYQRTGDLAFVESIWGNVERALAWMDDYGDVDGDGFVEYARRSADGLIAQGWKDSVDSVSHADGSLAEGPIALCEVQAYTYAARRSAAELARALGRPGLAEELSRQAETLRERFEQAFWCEDLGTYALALDGAKRPCRVRSSNAGHCLFAGIASPERARQVARTLMDESSYSGWGIRTLSAREARYNPISYHNGSVWPHDNALIAFGFSRYGLKDLPVRLLEGLYDASKLFDLNRMPELFCGFHRHPHQGPTRYPVACSPQAWAAGAVFLLLQACLGLEIDASRRRVSLAQPVLPSFLEHLSIRGLEVGGASVDLVLTRHTFDVGVTLERRQGDVEVVVVK